MKTFKHKITGNLATETSTGKNYRVTMPQNFTIPKWMVENSSEWEEIIVIPEYVKWVDNIGSGGSGWLCDSNQFEKGKIFDTKKDNFPFKITTWENALTPAWYPNNFIPSTKKEYDAQFIEYEILAFQYNDELSTLRDNGRYVYYKLEPKDCPDGKGATIEEMLDEDEYPECKIYSIKRKSDGEIFTIGDRVYIGGENRILGKFTLMDGILYMSTNNNKDMWGHIADWKKAKIPLFITEDKIEIFEGDEYWYVCNDRPTTLYSLDHADKGSGSRKDVHYFSTKQAAEDYINSKKVLFTTEDEVKLKKDDKMYLADTSRWINYTIPITACINPFMGDENQFKFFSTSKAAQDFIDNNKPQYSKQQVMKLIQKFDYNHRGNLELYRKELE